MVCYTLGHSTRNLERFIDILRQYKINCLIDVRSIPYAANKYMKDFDSEALSEKLKVEGVNYVYLGKELGGITCKGEIDNEEEGVEFDEILSNSLFKSGIEKVQVELNKKQRVCLLCSERNPLNCHRSILIGYVLSKRGILVEHIIDKDNTKNQTIIEEELFITYEPKLKNNLVQISMQDIMDSVDYDDISVKAVKRNIIEEGYRMKWKEVFQ